MIKKIIAFTLCVIVSAMMFAGCTNDKNGSDKNKNESTTVQTEASDASAEDMPTVLNPEEYTLYQNIFYNDQKDSFDGKDTVKEGTFATLKDEYNSTTRYYVWGYNDQTKCCDWQWEIKIDDTSKLPANGSLVKVSGKYEVNDSALDGLWITQPEITVETAFKARDYDIDMLSMGNTLERVQMANITQKKEGFEGKTVCCYGRVKDGTTLQDAYYDGSWEINFAGDNLEIPAFGTVVLVYGTVKDGQLTDCEIEANTQY
ncbi:MAG: hypothetical protein IJ077_02265 [Eubacterium sp.]|nr:hypothetical protein [Eubacterium sp.]MBR1531399.1 hypothetical protein [Eubacterium sp.]